MTGSISPDIGEQPGTSRLTRQQLDDRVVYRRAVEAVIWGMPAVNFDLMLQAFIQAGGGPNQVPYWSRLLDGQNQTLTRRELDLPRRPARLTLWGIANARAPPRAGELSRSD